ncbi:TauD/TfdA family dioxygenase [Aliiglaciecola sp. 3_MG-2023]|uniref:TauD/TfdA dioxygenase family protein n=1 Tax=Aliiglaciecola sp. 3_MG-2023 TaxID=3062644 RepID=UPI0026E46125|nr:TauD/TfdA family dioxygenase [Aliiglaciecola sp. 3_MG-2023]MDO6692992.1 TauD/TfdA family dioxygenase [Aliiglaciecola sp. 3_MG-2023]
MNTSPSKPSEELTIEHLKGDFGAQIVDVDLQSADQETLGKVVAAFHQHGAILLRNQTMEPDDLMRFINAFGEPELHTQTKFCLPNYPHIFKISNMLGEKGEPIGAHNDGLGWHTDYSYKEEPVMCTMLYAVTVPDEGGDTLLADQVAAYEDLSEEKKAQLDPLKIHHSLVHFIQNREFNSYEITDELRRENPDVIHPMIRVHPADGRKALWVSTGTVKHILGMEDDEAMALVDELVEYITQPKYVYAHKWQKGDVLMWDNRCTLHTGTVYDDKKYQRMAHRLWVKGEKPISVGDV